MEKGDYFICVIKCNIFAAMFHMFHIFIIIDLQLFQLWQQIKLHSDLFPIWLLIRNRYSLRTCDYLTVHLRWTETRKNKTNKMKSIIWENYVNLLKIIIQITVGFTIKLRLQKPPTLIILFSFWTTQLTGIYVLCNWGTLKYRPFLVP